MTVMLLQRSATPQLTHSQKLPSNRRSETETKPPFFFLLDSNPEGSAIHNNNHNHINNNNNHNNNNNNNSNHNNNNNNVNVNVHRSSCSNNNNTGKDHSFPPGNNDSGEPSSFGDTSSSSATQDCQDAGQGGVAMRYYRLWIYACNIVLLGSAVGFAAAVSRTLLFSGDPRRHLIPGLPRAFDPTALYAYLALATQLGLVQLLGCIAARRLSARLLNAYWVLLLALLFGDVVIGVAWVFRFERIRAELRPALRLRLQMDYGKEPRFSEQWDKLQRDFSCCGVVGPRDFSARWPQSCCGPSVNVSDPCQQPYSRGCEESLIRWLRKTADLLFVLGFCVIAFAKLCFLGILRYEIREMIQKIRLLKEPPPPSVSPFAQPPFTQVIPDGAANNGGIIARRTTLPNVTAPAGNTSILLQTEECNSGKHPLLSNNLQDAGADSDTNSHCALILEETTTTTSSTNHNCNAREKSNGNNNYEMRELNRRLLLSNGGNPNTGITTGSTNNRRT